MVRVKLSPFRTAFTHRRLLQTFRLNVLVTEVTPGLFQSSSSHYVDLNAVRGNYFVGLGETETPTSHRRPKVFLSLIQIANTIMLVYEW